MIYDLSIRMLFIKKTIWLWLETLDFASCSGHFCTDPFDSCGKQPLSPARLDDFRVLLQVLVGFEWWVNPESGR